MPHGEQARGHVHREKHDARRHGHRCERGISPAPEKKVSNEAPGADHEEDELSLCQPRERQIPLGEGRNVASHHTHDRSGDPAEGKRMNQCQDGRLVEGSGQVADDPRKRRRTQREESNGDYQKMDRQPGDDDSRVTQPETHRDAHELAPGRSFIRPARSGRDPFPIFWSCAARKFPGMGKGPGKFAGVGKSVPYL